MRRGVVLAALVGIIALGASPALARGTFRVTSFQSSPASVASGGGPLVVSVTTSRSATCTVTVSPRLQMFPITRKCGATKLSIATLVPPNSGVAHRFTFVVSASAGSDRATRTLTVLQKSGVGPAGGSHSSPSTSLTADRSYEYWSGSGCSAYRAPGYGAQASADSSLFVVGSPESGVGGNSAVVSGLFTMPDYVSLRDFPSNWYFPFVSVDAFSSDPAVASVAVVNNALGSGSGGLTRQVAPWVSSGQWQLSTWSGPNYTAYVMYWAYPNPTNGQDYVLITRFAATVNSRWQGDGARAMYSAASMRCTVQTLGASPPAVDLSQVSDTGQSSDYNAILGTQWVHDSTGRNFLVDSSNYSDTGPDGPGYYEVNNNDITRLSPGMS